MSEASNTLLARRWFEEVWNQRRDAAIDELMASDCVGHIEGDDAATPDRFRAFRTAFLTAMPDLRIVIEDTVAQGEHVVVRWRVTGTHSDDGLGIAPTGMPIDMRGMSWQRIADGRIVEGWDTWNVGGLLDSLRLQAAEQARQAVKPG